MPFTDDELDQVAEKLAEKIQGDNNEGEAITLALIDQKLKRICPIVEEDHETMLSVLGLESRVARLESLVMGLGGIEVIGLGILAAAVRLGWL